MTRTPPDPTTPQDGARPARRRSGVVLLTLAVTSVAPAVLVPFGSLLAVVVAVVAVAVLPARGTRRTLHLAALAVALAAAAFPLLLSVGTMLDTPDDLT